MSERNRDEATTMRREPRGLRERDTVVERTLKLPDFAPPPTVRAPVIAAAEAPEGDWTDGMLAALGVAIFGWGIASALAGAVIANALYGSGLALWGMS